MVIQGHQRTWEAWSRMAQVLKCCSKCVHLLEEKACLRSLFPGSAPVQPRLKTENRPWRKTRILCATGTPASRFLVIPSLLWINFKVRVSTGMLPGLISAQARGRQAGSLLYTVTHFKGLGGLAHTSTHSRSRAE